MSEQDWDPELDTVVFADRDAYESALAEAQKRGDFSEEVFIREAWMSQADLRGMRANFEKTGDPKLVLEAIFDATQSGFSIAPWAAEAFADLYGRVRDLEASKWEDVFGPLWPKNFPLKAERVKRALRFDVWRDVQRARDNRRALDTGLFEEIGKRYGLGSRTTASYYYDVEARLKRLGMGDPKAF